MTGLVVDASVAVKWFVPEIHAGSAVRVLSPNYELLAPDLIWVETGNALWKKWRRGEISEEVAPRIWRDLRRFPLRTYASHTLLESAWNLASRHDRSLYDSLYLALALSTGYPLLTADRKLYNSLKNKPHTPVLLWVEDIP